MRWASTPAHAAVFEDALSGVAAGRAGVSVRSSGSTAGGRADALREHGATVVVGDLADLLGGRLVIAQDTFPVDPWLVRETQLVLDLLGFLRVRLRAVQRAHRVPREPRRG